MELAVPRVDEAEHRVEEIGAGAARKPRRVEENAIHGLELLYELDEHIELTNLGKGPTFRFQPAKPARIG